MATLRRLTRPTMVAIAIALLAIAFVQARAYWPGIMPWDAIRQYDQALSGEFDDWHPPAMEWLWRQFAAVHPGPAPMLLLQLSLYWAGFAMLAGWALRQGRRGLAVALAACALLPVPMALMGAVLKDCLMAGTLMSATGLLAWSRLRPAPALRVLAILLLVWVSALRFNAFLACLPLLVALLPAAWHRTPARLGLTALAGAIALLAVMPIANRLLHAQKSNVELSQIIFDLGGITYHSGVDVFPTQPVADPIAINRRCYSPVKWDPYSWWVEAPCKIGFESVHLAIQASGIHPYVFWARAILAHPIAYAEHRLAHFNINTRFLVHDEIERPVTDQSPPNDWHYQIVHNPVQRAIDEVAVASGSTPLGWPICWLAAALGVLILVPRLPSRGFVLPVALSAFLYSAGYLVLSVAAELRYHLWTMLATAIAIAVAAADVAGGAPVSRRRLALASAPFVLVTCLCILWRTMPPA